MYAWGLPHQETWSSILDSSLSYPLDIISMYTYIYIYIYIYILRDKEWLTDGMSIGITDKRHR